MNVKNTTSSFRIIWVTCSFLFLLILITSVAASGETADAEDPIDEGATAVADIETVPAWLEPRSLSVVDMIRGGVDPSIFSNSTLAWQPGVSLLQYVSGSLSGDEVNIVARMRPESVATEGRCVGQSPFNDQWPVVVPASTVRITSNGVDVTDEAASIIYFPAGYTQPARGTAPGSMRYDALTIAPTFTADGRLELPANMGCRIVLDNNSRTNLRLDFIFDTPQYVHVDVLGSKEKSFLSYYWPGQSAVGRLNALNVQMADKYAVGDQGQHDYTRLDPPDGTEFVMMVFPPVNVDPYVSVSMLESVKPYPGSGTYRLRNYVAPFDLISVDHTTVSGLPLHGQTIDVDLHTSVEWLPFFKVDTYRFHAPEVMIHDSMTYQTCMNVGNCSDAVLQQVKDQTLDVDIYYMKATRVLAEGLTQIPVKQTGPNWTSRASDRIAVELDIPETVVLDPSMTDKVFLPSIYTSVTIPDDNPSANCPCGWFTEDGRMVDFVEG